MTTIKKLFVFSRVGEEQALEEKILNPRYIFLSSKCKYVPSRLCIPHWLSYNFLCSVLQSTKYVVSYSFP